MGETVTDASTASDVEDAILAIKRAGYLDMERVQAILDALVLAAEQVQDKRIELIEYGPEMNVTEMFVDFMIVAILDSTIVGSLLANGFKKVFKSLLMKKTLIKIIGEQEVKDWAKFLQISEKQLAKVTWEEESRIILDTKQYEEYRIAQTAVLSSAANHGANTKSVMKSSYPQIRKLLRNPPDMDNSDSPGVSILEATQSWASKLRMDIFERTNIIESQIRSTPLDNISKNKLAKFIELYDPGPMVEGGKYITINDIRSTLKLKYEAMIWAILFGIDTNTELEKSLFWPLTIKGPPKALVKYWYERFGKDIEEWSQTGYYSKGVVPLNPNKNLQVPSYAQNGFSSLPLEAKISYLKDYFSYIIQMSKAGIAEEMVKVSLPTELGKVKFL